VTELQPELRRDAPTDLSDITEHEGLADRIRTEIRASGPMPFARFMELALYDSEGGYYRSPNARPGRAGDFLTAPELHPIFGELVGRAIGQIWQVLGHREPFLVLEHGAGEGALAEPLLHATPPGVHYAAVEVDERRLAGLRARLAAAGLSDRLEPSTPSSFDGIVLANEVLDALPVHRLRRREDGIHELGVDVDPDGSFIEVEMPAPTSAAVERLSAEGIELVDGQTAEVCLALDDWIATASAPVRRGVLLLIDYGAPANELYDPVRRRDGTLRAYLRHQVSADPYRFVGRQDLTAHVDVTAVERAARAAGLTTIGITTQAEALMGLGIEERLRAIQADPTTTFEAYAALRSALLRLLDPAAMGRFRVMAFGRDWPDAAELALFSYRVPPRTTSAAAPPFD
jgi:SAM-dependent MidA family methyltransferase